MKGGGTDALDSLMNAFNAGPPRRPSGQIGSGAAGFRTASMQKPQASRYSNAGPGASRPQPLVIGARGPMGPSSGTNDSPIGFGGKDRHSQAHPASAERYRRAGNGPPAPSHEVAGGRGAAAHAGGRTPLASPNERKLVQPCSAPANVQRGSRQSSASKPNQQGQRRPEAIAVSAGPPSYGYYADANTRWRPYMEDAYAVFKDLEGLPSGSLYCGLYDGHGGRTAVDFVTAHLHTAIGAEVRSAGVADLHGALCRAFLRVDRMLLQAGALQCGTTVSVCVHFRTPGRPSELCTANVGDSRVILVRAGGEPAVRLSMDHLPSDPAETRRVQQQGGAIIAGRVGGSLAVSRALGDHSLKGTGGGVSGEPTCNTRRLMPEDKFVLMASDGVWDVISEQEAQAMLLAAPADATPNQLAKQVVQCAIQQGTRDNVSALVIRL